LSPSDAETAKLSILSRSARSLRNAFLGISAAASASSQAAVDAVARELTKAERRRRRRQQEREDEREEEREQLRARRRRRDHDDDDDDGDRIDGLRARHAALTERPSGSGRRVSAAQDADEDGPAGAADGRQTRRQQADARDEADADETSVVDAAQVVDPSDVRTGDATDTDTGSETAEIRVGTSETWASIDPETGTATAASNGVRAIAGPEGAFIEGSPSGEPVPTSAPPDDLPDRDGNDDGLDVPSPDGGDNVDDLLS
jgi:hypothetical protein